MIYLLLALFISSAKADATYPCETTYKNLNIPYVQTTSQEGLYYCLGLNHGSDRAWEMDFFRRVGQGRNAEILGFSQLKSDLMMRLLDLPAVANKLWAEFPAEQKKFFEIYSQGVNEGFKKGKNSKEFKDKDYEPEVWKGEDSLLVLLLQAFDQTRKTFFTDYEEELTKEKWKDRAASLFDQDNVPWENTILKDGEYEKASVDVKTTSTYKALPKLWAMFPTMFGLESGSNNWAVSSKKSKTGSAILANDPHLDLKTPMFWYWINIKTPEHAIMGGTVPGVPVFATGTNGKVSWGLTNAYLNSADAVLVKDLKDSEIISFRPTVYIKFWFFKIPFFFKSFEKLVTGHRILPLDIESDHKLALKWTGFNLKTDEVVPMMNLFKVSDVQGMNDLIDTIGVPSWNFVYADNKGDVGYSLVGKVYKHTSKIPYGVPVMTLDEFAKEEFLEPEHRPQVVKPERNYVYTANNRHWPMDAKYYGGRGYSSSIRAQRIDNLLQDDQDIESFKTIQCDRRVNDARYLLPKLDKYLNASEFKNWDMLATDSSTVLPLYRRLIDLLHEEWKVNDYALFRLLDDLDKDEINSLKEIFAKAKAETGGRTWGDIHKVKFPHMSRTDNWTFSPEIPGIGDTHSVDPGTSSWDKNKRAYEQYSGASMRMIIEMKDKPIIWLALPGLNREYDVAPSSDAWMNWKTCQYTQVEF